MRKVALALVFGGLALGVAQPGDALAEVKCGDTVNEDVTLTDADPIVNEICTGKGLVLGNVQDKFGIVLDCGGRTIRGSGKGNGLMTGSGVEGVTIVNCVVDGFGTGILLKGPGFHTLERSVVMNSNGDGVVVESNENFIIGNVSQQNKGWGFIVRGQLNELSEANVALDNGKGGIMVRGKEHFVDGNFAIRNGGNGLDANGTILEISFTLAVANAKTGVLVTGGKQDDPSFVSDNVAIANDGDGVFATKGSEDGGGNVGLANKGIACQINGVACDSF